MSRNQQIQNFIDALEQATGISVDADLTAESVTIEDSNGDELAITTAGGITVTDDGNFEVADVLSTLTVTDDGTLDVNSVSAVVETTTPSTTTGSSYGVQQADSTPTLILGVNESRESVLLQNKGSGPVYVGFDDTVSSLKGVEIAAGGTYADDTYTGDLYAITGGGTVNVAFQEVATE